MMTFWTIMLIALCALNIVLAFFSSKRERKRMRDYQSLVDECDERVGEAITEMGKAKMRLREAQSANAALKKSYEETIKEYEKLVRDYRKLENDFEALKKGKEPPVDAGQPTHHTQPGEPADKPVKQRRGRKPKK